MSHEKSMGVAGIRDPIRVAFAMLWGCFEMFCFFRNLLTSRCYVGFMSMSVFSRSKNNTKTRKSRGSVMKKFYASARVLRRTFVLFLFTYLGSTFSGSLGIIVLLLPTSSPLQKIGLTFTFNFQPKSLKIGYALVWFEPYNHIQPVSNSDLWVDLELFKSWHFLRNLRANGLQEHDYLRWAPKIYKWRLAQKCVPT